MCMLSSIGNINPFREGVNRRSGKKESTAHAAPTVFSPIQKHNFNLQDSSVPFEQWSEVRFGVQSLALLIVLALS